MSTTLPTRISQGFASLGRRDPFRALHEEVDDLLNRFSNDFDAEWLMRPFAPAADVSETDGAVEVRIDVPGMDPKDIDVQVSNGLLHVTGERKEEREEKGKTWHKVERRTGAFSRTVSLPCEVQDQKTKADYKDGVLTITLPKSVEARPHKVKVGGNGK
ncbi:MAG: Hsp20/alpha crystallin family protein [Planctomycetaceae bacterium]